VKTVAYHLRTGLLWLVWLALAATWVSTLVANVQEGNTTAALVAAVNLVLLGILYLAEGLELAATDLLDKDPTQLSSPELASLLLVIQGRARFFYANRQVFVVVIISFMSLTTTYPWLYVPGIGKIEFEGALFWFSLVFTTLTVLWFGQVLPKQLAVINSEKFFGESRVIWPLIKAVGTLGLPTPAETLVKVFTTYSGYKEVRHLKPNRASQYSVATHEYGFSLDSLAMSITLDQGGSAKISRKMLLLFLHGGHGETYGSFHTGSSFVKEPKITVLGLYRAPVPERFEMIGSYLDSIFSEDESPVKAGVSENLLPHWKHQIEVDVEENLASGESATWAIRGERLPEAFLKDTDGAHSEFLALLYRVDAELSEHAFGDWNSEWPETVELPCRVLKLAVSVDEEAGCAVIPEGMSVSLSGSSRELPEKTMFYSREALVNHGKVAVYYPLQGATYNLRWKMLTADQIAHPARSRSTLRADVVAPVRRSMERSLNSGQSGRTWTPGRSE
jgi:hypothetical protein